MKKVYLRSNGCIENLLDGKSYRNYLEENGWEVVRDPAEAELIIVNTCAFDKRHEEISIADIEELKRYKAAQLVVSGCLPKINEERMKAVFAGVSFGPRETDRLRELIGSRREIAWKDQHTIGDEDVSRLPHRQIVHRVNRLKKRAGRWGNYILPNFDIGLMAGDQDTYFISIGTGCLGHCTYCAIKRAKGSLSSVPPERIVAEFHNGLQAGYRRFALTADDTGAYGQDIGTDLPALVDQLLEIEGDYRLSIYHLEPNWLIDGFESYRKLVRTAKIEGLICPVQSGSNRVLRAMNRPYTVEDYLRSMRALRDELPGLKIWNQFIVGFPGETDSDFEASLSVLDQLECDLVQAFPYSDRPGTEAVKLDDHVPDSVIRKRIRRMNTKIFIKFHLRKLRPWPRRIRVDKTRIAGN